MAKIGILIVEDEALIAENLKYTLEDLGYEVASISYTFHDALEKIRENNFDLALLDINLGSTMPEENGLQLARTIVKENKKPFIFLTAYSDRETITEATITQPGSYLIKPVNPATLFAGIQTTIERYNNDSSEEASKQTSPEYFFIKIGSRNHKLMWSQVYGIESGKNYVRLKIMGETRDYPIRGTLAFVMEQLLPGSLKNEFIRISRSVCINRNSVTSFTASEIYCQDECFENTRFTHNQLKEIFNQNGQQGSKK